MVKNDIWLGGASKQNNPFLKTFAPKNAPMPLMSRTGPVKFFQSLDIMLYLLGIELEKKFGRIKNCGR